jgi:hypothetical protein
MIGTIVTVTLETTNISSSSTLYTTTMYTIAVPVKGAYTQQAHNVE